MAPRAVAVAALLCLGAAGGAAAIPERRVNVEIDLGATRNVSDKLYGIFFEEINHAGEGGLYAELLQDRSFDALALTSGFSGSERRTQELGAAAFQPLAGGRPPLTQQELTGRSGRSGTLAGAAAGSNAINQPVAWHPLGSAKLGLSKERPVSAHNPVAAQLTALEAGDGLANSGYWGVPLSNGSSYHFSVYLRGDASAKVQVALTSADGRSVYAAAKLGGLSSGWRKLTANLTANGTDPEAWLALRLLAPGTVAVDSLSLFPLENLRPGWQNPYPFRADLLQLLKGLQPRFVRFPGGCYVEGGDWLANRFPWRTNLGLYEDRTGHANDVWGYWSTDGLGLYEYMLLADELGAEPVYVVNNGISHQQSTPPEQLQPFLAETFEALEFLTGAADSRWGAVRASMGRREPWTINYLAIGNEDCGRPYYVEDYNRFYSALKERFPGMTLIANCPMQAGGPTDLWDWHSYDVAWTMFSRHHEFDGLVRGRDPPVFVSEYAVTADGGYGNLRGAVAEASFMTGMERNADIIKLASYAPLFVHTKNRIWPTNMIVIDNHRAYKTPSYLVQQLFSRWQGVATAAVSVTTADAGTVHQDLVAASATCQAVDCATLAIKAANFASFPQNVTVSIAAPAGLEWAAAAVLHHVSGSHPEAENSFEHPELVVIASDKLDLHFSKAADGLSFEVTLPPWSASALVLSPAKPTAAVAAFSAA